MSLSLQSTVRNRNGKWSIDKLDSYTIHVTILPFMIVIVAKRRAFVALISEVRGNSFITRGCILRPPYFHRTRTRKDRCTTRFASFAQMWRNFKPIKLQASTLLGPIHLSVNLNMSSLLHNVYCQFCVLFFRVLDPVLDLLKQVFNGFVRRPTPQSLL